MLRYLRLYYNYLLFLLGVRKTLPAYFVNRMAVRECGEELVEWRGGFVRKTAAKMLDRAESLLPKGCSLQLLEGWRSQEEQSRRRKALLERLAKERPELSLEKQRLFADRCVANKSGHLTGGAVDVTLVRDGCLADCGTEYLEFNERTVTTCRLLSPQQQENRRILLDAMTAAGFVNFPLEWWHYCYGDRMFAAYRRAAYGIYDNVVPEPNHLEKKFTDSSIINK